MHKLENTIENKIRFFAFYFGQYVMRLPNNNDLLKVTDWFKWNEAWLELLPLSQISDEDAIVIGRYRYSNPKSLTYQIIGKGIVNDFLIRRDGKGSFELELFEIDYLRKKGYALPFENLSIDDLINYGWVKLKEK